MNKFYSTFLIMACSMSQANADPCQIAKDLGGSAEQIAMACGQEVPSSTKTSCTSDISGTYTSDSQTVTLNSDGSGTFSIKAIRDGILYNGDVNYRWSATPTSITMNYTSDLVYKRASDGSEDKRARPKNGTVDCKYLGNAISIGHVLYSRQ